MAQNTLFRRTLCSLQIRLAAPHSRKASLATPRRNSVGCSRMCLRLCLRVAKIRTFGLRVAKIRTFAPLLVPLRCAGTIALLSDFCSAGLAAPAAFLSQGIISNTPQVMRGVRFLPHAKNQRFFPRGPRCVSAKEKCKTFAPLLVLSLCSKTIALLSDFCSAG